MGAHPEESGVVIAAEHHDHEPDEQLGPDEPRTPMWLPFVGGIVFVLGIVSFVATRPPGKTASELQKEAATAASELRAKREAEKAPPAVTAPAVPNMPGVPNPAMPQPGRAPGRGG
jgi:hypothetical protein